MKIETERLILRPWEITDVKHCYKIGNDIGFNCFALPGFFYVRNEEEALVKLKERIALYEKEKLGKFVVELKTTGEFIGACGIEAYELDGKREIEMGYRLCLDYWGKGYATEAAKAAIQYSWDLGLKKIIAFALVQNEASLHVIEKLGFNYLRNFVRLNQPHKLYELNKK